MIEIQSVIDDLNSSDNRVGIRAVFNFCIDMIERHNFVAIDHFMNGLDVEKLAVAVMLAPLSITVPFAARLSKREQYYDRVEARLKVIRPADVERLLQGLK